MDGLVDAIGMYLVERKIYPNYIPSTLYLVVGIEWIVGAGVVPRLSGPGNNFGNLTRSADWFDLFVCVLATFLGWPQAAYQSAPCFDRE